MDKVHKIKYIIPLLSCLLLQGCVTALFTGAGLVYDRHELQNQINNQVIAQQIKHQIYANEELQKDSSITVASFNYDVLLAGQTPTQEQRSEALAIAKATPGVKRIYNDINIGEPESVFRSIKDSWITTKINSKVLIANELNPHNIKIITENGTVYLMGSLKPENVKLLERIAKNTDGVKKIVKMVRYIRETLV